MTGEPSNQVTQLLARLRTGDEQAREELFPLVYEELHGLADRQMHRQPPGHTLQATALVNEALMRLFQAGNSDWEDRAHFYAVASKAMRRILVDHARRKARLKRQPAGKQIALEEMAEVFEERSIDLDGLDHALEKLAEIDERMVGLVELRFFGGRSMRDAAEMLGMSLRTAEREWGTARAWLRRWLE